MVGPFPQPHEFRISEDLPEGSVVGSEMIPSVNDLDTIENPIYFYMANGEGTVELHRLSSEETAQ